VRNPAPTLPEVAERYADSPYRLYLNQNFMLVSQLGLDTADPAVVEEVFRLAKLDYEEAAAAGTAVESEPWISEPNSTLHAPVVYYMRIGPVVKIGTSKRISTRLQAINPQGVMAVEFGGLALERIRHRQFVAQHVHGEWFDLAAPIAEHVVNVRAEFESASGMSTEEWLVKVGARAWSPPAC
jgi:hypothetical protein